MRADLEQRASFVGSSWAKGLVDQAVVPAMSAAANPLSDGDIEATNVRPAFEASLAFGATEAELASALGWRRDALSQPDARVSGASTYAHMEMMFARPRFAEFVLAAVRAHDVSSLGVVGLA